MADILGERLGKLIEERRTTQSRVAQEIGVSQPSIGRLISGETRETGKIIELARALKTTPEYLIGETEDPSPDARPVISAEPDPDLVEIDSIDLAYGMGGTFLDTDAIKIQKVKFSRKWLRQFTNSAPHLLCSTRGMGDSMMPTIHDQDVVIIDRSQTKPEMGARLAERMRELGLNQSALAARIGVSQPTIGRMINGETRESAKIVELAQALKTTAHYLIGETDDPNTDALPVISKDLDPDLVEIDSIDLAYGMGGTFLDTDAIKIEKVKFSRKWLRQFTHSAPHLLCSTRGMGDSMMPTIHDQDVVIIDRSQTKPEMGDKIWAVIFAGLGMIKRLRALPDGTMRISSDNQLVRDEIAADGELFIVGRVVAVVKSV